MGSEMCIRDRGLRSQGLLQWCKLCCTRGIGGSHPSALEQANRKPPRHCCPPTSKADFLLRRSGYEIWRYSNHEIEPAPPMTAVEKLIRFWTWPRMAGIREMPALENNHVNDCKGDQSGCGDLRSACSKPATGGCRLWVGNSVTCDVGCAPSKHQNISDPTLGRSTMLVQGFPQQEEC